jgi:hypothetical protein
MALSKVNAQNLVRCMQSFLFVIKSAVYIMSLWKIMYNHIIMRAQHQRNILVKIGCYNEAACL